MCGIRYVCGILLSLIITGLSATGVGPYSYGQYHQPRGWVKSFNTGFIEEFGSDNYYIMADRGYKANAYNQYANKGHGSGQGFRYNNEGEIHKQNAYNQNHGELAQAARGYRNENKVGGAYYGSGGPGPVVAPPPPAYPAEARYLDKDSTASTGRTVPVNQHPSVVPARQEQVAYAPPSQVAYAQPQQSGVYRTAEPYGSPPQHTQQQQYAPIYHQNYPAGQPQTRPYLPPKPQPVQNYQPQQTQRQQYTLHPVQGQQFQHQRPPRQLVHVQPQRIPPENVRYQERAPASQTRRHEILPPPHRTQYTSIQEARQLEAAPQVSKILPVSVASLPRAFDVPVEINVPVQTSSSAS